MQWMSFALTPEQMKAKTKTVTRRLGWKNLKPGTLIHAAERTRGLTLAERKLVSLDIIRVVSVRRERLDAITAADVKREGFPKLTPQEFIAFFCRSHGDCQPDDEVTRIEFRFMKPGEASRIEFHRETLPAFLRRKKHG